MSKWKAHKTFKVSRSTIDDWLKLKEETGSLCANTDYHRGQRPAIEDTAETRAFFDEHNDKTLEQLRHLWHEKTGNLYSDVTLSKTLRRLGYTRKKRVIVTLKVMKPNKRSLLRS